MASSYYESFPFFRKENNERPNIVELTGVAEDQRDGADTVKRKDQHDKRDGEGDANTINSITRSFNEEFSFRSNVPFKIDLPFQVVRAQNTTTIIVSTPLGINAAKVRIRVPENTKSVIITFGTKCFPKTWFDPFLLFPEKRYGGDAIVWQDALDKDTEYYKACSMEIKLDYDVFFKDDAIISIKNGTKYIVIELSEVSNFE
jgi:hypothetical protein